MSEITNRRKFRRRVATPPKIYPAQLGDGAGHLRVTGLANYCYARIGGHVEVVYNDATPYTYDLMVDCGRDTLTGSEKPGPFRVLGMRTTSPAGQGAQVATGYAPAKRYQLFADGGGQDPLWVDKRQVLDLQPAPYSGMTIQIYPGIVYDGTDYLEVAFTTVDLTAHIPSTAGKAAMVLISVNTSGAVVATKGTEFTLSTATTITLLLANRPAPPAGTAYEIALVRVYNTQTSVTVGRAITDIYDLRGAGYFNAAVGGGVTALTGDVTATGPGSAAATIANSAVTLAKMANLAESTVIGRAVGAGTGVPQALTSAQMAAIADVAHLWVRTTGDTMTDQLVFLMGSTNSIITAFMNGLQQANPLMIIYDSAIAAKYKLEIPVTANATKTVLQTLGSVSPIVLSGDVSNGASSNFSMKNTSTQWEFYSDSTGSGVFYFYQRTASFSPFHILPTGGMGLGGSITLSSGAGAAVTIGARTVGGMTINNISNTRQLDVLGHTTQTNPPARIKDETSATNTVRDVLDVETQSTGTAAAGLGSAIRLRLETATAGTVRTAGRIWSEIVEAANATFKAITKISAWDTAERVGITIEADGSAAKITTLGETYLNSQTNGIKISTTGALTCLGTAKYERHVQIEISTAGNISEIPDFDDVFTAAVAVFPTTGSRHLHCQWEIPDDWDGTDAYIEVDTVYLTAASGTDTVKWDCEYRSIAEGETINNGTSVTASVTDSGDYAQYVTKHQRFTLTYNSADQPLTVQDHIYFKISRDTAVANDFGGSVGVTALEIIYTSKGFPTSN